MKKAFPGFDGSVIVRAPSKWTSLEVGPASYNVTITGPLDASVPAILYFRADGHFLLYEYFGPMPHALAAIITENMNGTGTNFLQGASYFNKYVVQHLIAVTEL